MTTNLEYTKTQPNRIGYYWLKQGSSEKVVYVMTQRAFGNRLCALVDFRLGREWMAVEDVSDALWAGPIPSPLDK